MPFYCEPIEGTQFDKISDVEKWVVNEGRQLSRIPLAKLLDQGARFSDDEYFGDEYKFLKFNQHGIRALLQPLGLRFETLNLVEQPGLVSDLLNDLIAQQEIRNRLEHSHFVVNGSSDTVLGAVSESYITYTNQEFLRDIRRVLEDGQQANLFADSSDTLGRFRFVNGFSVNTQTYLRFTITVKSGRVASYCGESEDISEVGIQFKNSMVGDSAVTIQYFVNRLICANGLIVPAGSSYSRVIHTGRRETFLGRLGKCFREVECKIGAAGEAIKALMAIDFDPEALVRANMVEAIFEIIPGSRSEIMGAENIRKRPKQKMTEAGRIEHEASVIAGIPDHYAGEYSRRVFNSPYRSRATMFDFINIFTEYAQTQPIYKRLEIEEKTGLLADQIAKNRNEEGDVSN